MNRDIAEGFLAKLRAHRVGTTGVEGATEHADESHMSSSQWSSARHQPTPLEREKETEARLRELRAIAKTHAFVIEGTVADAMSRRDQMLGIHQRVKDLENAPKTLETKIREVDDLIRAARSQVNSLAMEADRVAVHNDRRDSVVYWAKIAGGLVFVLAVAVAIGLMIGGIWWFTA